MKSALLVLLPVLAVQSHRCFAADDARSDEPLPPFAVMVDRDPYEDAAIQVLNEAEADLKKGSLRVLRYGHPSLVLNKTADMLKARYGIEIVSKGCVYTDVETHAAAVYNAVMQREILARHGKSLAQLEYLIEAEPASLPKPTWTIVPSSPSRITAGQRFQLLKGACASGDQRAVEILLACGADPNGAEDWKTEEIGGRYGDEFSSPMSVAARAGHIEIIKLLLRHGAAVDVLEGEGHTPLSLAIYAKQKEVVRFLLSVGADPTKRMVTDSLSRCEDPEIKALVGQAIKVER